MHFFHKIVMIWSAKKNDTKTLFSHPPSPFPSNVCNCNSGAFVLLCNSRFNVHCYTQHEATPTQKSAQKWCCDLLWLLVWKITKGIHLCKPASLNHPIARVCWWDTTIIGGSWHKYHFCHDKNMSFLVTKVCLWWPNFCSDKHIFCCNKSFVLEQAYFCRDKHMFVMTKHVFCHDKSMLVVTELVSQQTRIIFVTTKIFCHDKHNLLRQKWYLWQLLPMIHNLGGDFTWNLPGCFCGYEWAGDIALGLHGPCLVSKCLTSFWTIAGYSQCVLVGHDWGGALAWSFANMYPDMLSHLIVLNCPNTHAFSKHIQSSFSQFKMSWWVWLLFAQCCYWSLILLKIF